MKWFVERTQSWAVEAETEEEALQICRDGGGTAPTDDWYAERGDWWEPPMGATDAV